jgi:hypothetical protein
VGLNNPQKAKTYEEMRADRMQQGELKGVLEPIATRSLDSNRPNLARFSAQEQSCVCARLKIKESVIDNSNTSFG